MSACRAGTYNYICIYVLCVDVFRYLHLHVSTTIILAGSDKILICGTLNIEKWKPIYAGHRKLLNKQPVVLFFWCWWAQNERVVEGMSEMVVFCHLCLVWRGPFIMPWCAQVCVARVAVLVCVNVHASGLCVRVHVCTCVCQCRCVGERAWIYVRVAPRTCPLAMASLNISLMSNIICTVRLN